MENVEFEIIFYTKDNGKVPVAEFLDNLELLNEELWAKAIIKIDLLAEFGFKLTEPHVKFIKNGVYELRIKFDNNHTRIFYFFAKGKKIILTNGFIKKTNKTPSKEIKIAVDYKNNYEANFKE